MKILALETSSEKSLLAFKKDGEVFTKILPGGPLLSKKLALEVALLLKEVASLPDLIAVGEGPGSYTGIRVGASLAQALSLGWKIPLLGFCSLKAFAASPQEGPFAVLFDAKMGGLYVLKGEMKNRVPSFESPERISLKEAPLFLEKIPLFLSPHPEEIKKKVVLSGDFLETEPSAALLLPLIEKKFLEKGPSSLNLTYLSTPS